MNFIKRFFYELYKYIIFLPLFITLFLTMSAFTLVFSAIFGEKAAAFYTKVVHHTAALLIPLRVEINGQENFDKNKSYVIIANHRSNLDSVALYKIKGSDYRWVMKNELLRVPIFGFFAKRMGNIAIDRKNPEKAKKSINAAKKRISGGTSVVFFPEGTRNNGEGMLPFKKGAFHFAIDTQLPILPITINHTDKLLPKYSLNLKCGTVEVHIHPEIDTSKYSKDSIVELLNNSRNIISQKIEI